MTRDAVSLSIAGVQARLEAWGKWANAHGVGGYATVEAALVRNGGALISGQGARVEPECPEEMQIDGILASMPDDLRREREALIARYRRVGMPLELVRHHLRPRASVATLKFRLRVGHVWVLGRLQAQG